jgi:hypothetical protein
MVAKILGSADAPRRIMSALADAIRGVSVTPRQRRMAEVVVEAISAQGMVPSKRRTAWLAYGDDLVRAIDNGEPFEALLEEGYRNALFESDPRSERSARPGEGESLDGIVKFRSAGDIRNRLG